MVSIRILAGMTRRPLLQRHGLAALGACALLAAAAVLLSPEAPAPQPASALAAAHMPTPAPVVPAALSTQTPATAGTAPADAAAPPPGVSGAQWAGLRAEMAQRPDGTAELARLSAYFRFTDTAQRFRQARQSAASAELPALARELDDALPERLRQRELSAAEATQLKTAILEVQVADASERALRLQQWQQALPGTVLPLSTPDPRQAEFLRRQSAVLAAWSAQPLAQRDAHSLEQQLDALRRSSFPTPIR